MEILIGEKKQAQPTQNFCGNEALKDVWCVGLGRWFAMVVLQPLPNFSLNTNRCLYYLLQFS
jgi:hypothetical protein